MNSSDKLKYLEDNVDENCDFASNYSKQPIKRFIFLSSKKVNGESTNTKTSFR